MQNECGLVPSNTKLDVAGGAGVSAASNLLQLLRQSSICPFRNDLRSIFPFKATLRAEETLPTVEILRIVLEFAEGDFR
jgi:hypothetical protein